MARRRLAGDNVLLQTAITGVLVSSAALELLLSWPYHMAASSSNAVYEYGHSILRSVPEDTRLLVSGDLNKNVVRYLQQCENMRPDVDIINIDSLTFPWFVETQVCASLSLFPSLSIKSLCA
jgi:hypothetical protein